jgi:hypothetical protein
MLLEGLFSPVHLIVLCLILLIIGAAFILRRVLR